MSIPKSVFSINAAELDTHKAMLTAMMQAMRASFHVFFFHHSCRLETITITVANHTEEDALLTR